MKVVFILFFALVSLNVFAHEGRAYLLFEHKKIGTDDLSVRIDPDKEKGTFEFFITGSPAGNYNIELKSSPVRDSSHVLATSAALEKDQSTPERLVYKAVLPFDRAENWNVEISLKQKDNTVFSSKELVEVVEPGPNKKEFLLFLLPFTLIGLLGFKVFLAKRKLAR